MAVVEFAELGGVQSELAGHLDVCVGELVAFAGVGPGLQSGWERVRLAHVSGSSAGTPRSIQRRQVVASAGEGLGG
jgi:hypothetical protein